MRKKYGKHPGGSMDVTMDEDGNVYLDFGKPIAWASLTPDEAEKLARKILANLVLKEASKHGVIVLSAN
jgi:hypothetical protein